MPPRMKSKSNKTRSRKNNVPKAEKIALKSSSSMKTRSKLSTVPTTPKNTKKSIDPPIPSSSTDEPSVTPVEESQKVKNEMDLVTPKMMKYYLNAYKQSPTYSDLKNKRFNTSFFHERPRRDRDIQIYPDEISPVTENRMEPGDKYANVFLNMPGLSDSDEDIKPVEVKTSKGKGAGTKGKRGRKKSIGYKGLPLSDEAMMIDYSCLFRPSSSQLDTNEGNNSATSDE